MAPEYKIWGHTSPYLKYNQFGLSGQGDEDALLSVTGSTPDGIYEAIGPKIQGNPEGLETHALAGVVPYDAGLILMGPERCFAAIQSYLRGAQMEGIVFHHPDGRMAKIKKRDFGLKR